MSKIVTQNGLNELVNAEIDLVVTDKSDNELVTASEAKDLLKITTSKPDNQCVTYGDIKEIADSPTPTIGTIFAKFFNMGGSRDTIQDGFLYIYNSTPEKIKLAPAAYPEPEIIVDPNGGYVVRDMRNGVEVPRSAIVIGKLRDGNIYCHCISSHSTYYEARWLIVIF